MNLDQHLEKLKYFYEVARLGSLKKASESVYITQPSLTKSIKILEESVGTPLFHRMPRGMRLTEQGELLYQYCHRLFASVADIEQKLLHPDDPYAGSLKVGTYDSIGIYFWPKFLKKFLSQYDKVQFEMNTGRSSSMQEKLEAGELDLILVVDPKASDHIAVDVFRKDTFKLYETTKQKKVYSNLDEAPLMVMSDALAGMGTLKDILTTTPYGTRKIYHNSSLESVKEFTLNGLGIGLLPSMVARNDVKRKQLKEVKTSSLPKSGIGEHNIGIAYQMQRKDNPLIKVLIKELKEYKWS